MGQLKDDSVLILNEVKSTLHDKKKNNIWRNIDMNKQPENIINDAV